MDSDLFIVIYHLQRKKLISQTKGRVFKQSIWNMYTCFCDSQLIVFGDDILHLRIKIHLPEWMKKEK